ncbi:MAG: hypothetical protein E7576_01135, partial [Ruminococcaceae bacterium]|nr:hypothetical protein [Oscillospiraceae bacterium]
MKKVLSFFVLTALLLSLIVVPVSAADDDTPEGVAVQGTPTVDGVIDDLWASVPAYPIDRLKDGRDTGLTSQFRVMWQPGALYVLIEVNDSDHNFNGGPSVGDGMEVYFDLNNLKSAGFEDDLQAYFAMCADDETYLTYDGSSMGMLNLQEAATVAMTTADDKYTYEAQILMQPMETELKAGQVIGFDIQVNDQVSGDTERSGAYGWSDDANNAWQGTMLYGNLTLQGGASEKTGSAQPVDVVEIPEKAAAVDGVISDGEWDGATRMILNISDTSTWTENGAGIVGTDGWSKLGHTDEDFETELAFMVDGEDLYILLTRVDSTLNFASDNFHRPYSSDCALMWFFDTEYASQYGLQLLAADKSGNPIIGYFFMDSDQNSSDNLMELEYATAVTKITDNGYVMEAKVNMKGMDDFNHDMLAGGTVNVTWCAVNICEEGWDSDNDAYQLWGTYNYQAQYKGVNDWEAAPKAKLVSASAASSAPAASSSDYVTDGLVAWYDGANNQNGSQDKNATVWKDASGNGLDFEVDISEEDNYWTDKSFHINSCRNYFPDQLVDVVNG